VFFRPPSFTLYRALQDSSHVSLVSFMIRSDGFDHFRCDRAQSLGINMASMAKVLKCSNTNDAITLKAEDSGDKLTFMFENESMSCHCVSLTFGLSLFFLRNFQFNDAMVFLSLARLLFCRGRQAVRVRAQADGH
jgi:hypothetical protein